MSPRGVGTVAAHEFRLRLRAGRWRWLLTAWFVTLLILTATLRLALVESGQQQPGADMFGGLVLFMLGLALLVVPALTAQSVNGDRDRGVLATLQTTLLTPADIAVGKLVAAWGTALVFLLTSLPLVFWCLLEGGVATARVPVSLGITALLLGVMCAIAQCLSAMLSRTITSAVMSYLTVFGLTIGTVVAFGIALGVTQTTATEHTGGATYEVTEAHPEQVWWLLAPNPFVIVADSAPPAHEPAADLAATQVRLDPLGAVGDAVRSTRAPLVVGSNDEVVEEAGAAVWPYGLAVNLLLGTGALILTTRRLRTPYGHLPRGVRVA